MAKEQVNTDEILYQIITDRRYISAIDGNGETVDLMVRSLTPTERTRSEFIYNRAMRKARISKLPSEKQCMAAAISSGWWTKDKEKLITLRQAEIDRIKKENERRKHNKGKQIKYRTDLIIANKALNALLGEQASLCAHSAESYARTERANYIISRITLSAHGDQLWIGYEQFLKETDSKFLGSLVHGYNGIEHYSEKQVRAVARSSSWSVMWNTSKKCGDSLFGISSSHYSPEQTLLCYWSMMYDSVYESVDKPNDRIIESDEQLDKWFQEQKKSIKSNSAGGGDLFQKHKGGGASQQEEFVMVVNEEEADDVYDMNDKWSLARIREETQRIEATDGDVQEFELRKNRIKKQLILDNSGKFAEARKKKAGGSGFLG